MHNHLIIFFFFFFFSTKHEAALTQLLSPQILFACLAAAAFAFPQNPEGDAEVVFDERTDQGDGNFRYAFETSNGIRAEKTGVPGSAGQSNMQGSFL